MRVCESLLLTPLNPMTRKLINSTKARVSGLAKNTGKAPVTDKKAPGKDASSAPKKEEIDQVIFEVVA
jgi:hypothetical protein